MTERKSQSLSYCAHPNFAFGSTSEEESRTNGTVVILTSSAGGHTINRRAKLTGSATLAIAFHKQ
jgi:hypothetical protein